MAIIPQEDWNTRDIYFYHNVEGYFLKYEFKSRRYFVKPEDQGREYELSFDNRLVCDIKQYGIEVTKSDYDTRTPVEDPDD